jgi:CheY-like chemotaxis protein
LATTETVTGAAGPDPKPDATPDPPAMPKPPACRILVVDDNVDAARGLSRLLTILGYDVETVYDGPDALAAAARPPDVVLLDLGLPGMDGYEVASRFRTELGLTAALIVVISGYSWHGDRILDNSTGVDHHLVKPVNFNDLRALLPPPG